MQNNQCDFNIIEKILIRLDLELNMIIYLT